MSCLEVPLLLPSSGYMLSAYTHVPLNSVGATALMLHGFTGNKIEANRLFVDIARSLCSIGVAVLRFDYRGHGDSPLSFDEFRFEYALEDAENALNYLVNNYKPRKIVLIGLSMGGHIAVRLAATHRDKVSCIVLLSPALRFGEPKRDLRLFTQRVDDYYILGPFRIKAEALESMSKYNAIELADKISASTLIIHAKDDQLVPYTQSVEFYEKLAVQDKELVVLEEGGHIFSTYTSKTGVISRIVNWVKERVTQT